MSAALFPADPQLDQELRSGDCAYRAEAVGVCSLLSRVNALLPHKDQQWSAPKQWHDAMTDLELRTAGAVPNDLPVGAFCLLVEFSFPAAAAAGGGAVGESQGAESAGSVAEKFSFYCGVTEDREKGLYGRLKRLSGESALMRAICGRYGGTGQLYLSYSIMPHRRGPTALRRALTLALDFAGQQLSSQYDTSAALRFEERCRRVWARCKQAGVDRERDSRLDALVAEVADCYCDVPRTSGADDDIANLRISAGGAALAPAVPAPAAPNRAAPEPVAPDSQCTAKLLGSVAVKLSAAAPGGGKPAVEVAVKTEAHESAGASPTTSPKARGPLQPTVEAPAAADVSDATDGEMYGLADERSRSLMRFFESRMAAERSQQAVPLVPRSSHSGSSQSVGPSPRTSWGGAGAGAGGVATPVRMSSSGGAPPPPVRTSFGGGAPLRLPSATSNAFVSFQRASLGGAPAAAAAAAPAAAAAAETKLPEQTLSTVEAAAAALAEAIAAAGVQQPRGRCPPAEDAYVVSATAAGSAAVAVANGEAAVCDIAAPVVKAAAEALATPRAAEAASQEEAPQLAEKGRMEKETALGEADVPPPPPPLVPDERLSRQLATLAAALAATDSADGDPPSHPLSDTEEAKEAAR